MSLEEDPEVVADLRLRAYTEKSRKGLSHAEFGQAIRATATPPKIVDRVPCRGRCGAVVDWPEEAEEQFAMFNRVLASKAEAPLDKTRIVFCAACVKRGREAAAESNRQRATWMAGLIRELKADPGPKAEREREILEKLKPHHPDLEGLVQAIRERRAVKPSTQTRRGKL